MLVYRSAAKIDRPFRDSLATLAIGLGLTLATVQIVSAMGDLNVDWVEPLKTMRSVLSFLTFDIGILMPGCWLGNMTPFISYAGSLLMYPLGSWALMTVFAAAKFLFKKPVTVNQIINGQGLIFSAIYIALTLLAVRPFQCVANPDGTSSLISSRDVICWKDGVHSVMVSLAVFPLTAVAAYLALIVWAVHQYPKRMVSPSGIHFVKRFKFIFSRFSPSSYYFACIMTMRSFVVGMVPVFSTEHPELQYFLLTTAIVGYAILQARLWPWRTELANRIDAGMCLFLALVILLGSMIFDFDPQRGATFMQVLLLLGTAFALIVFSAIIGRATWKAWKPALTYGIFLSHHKLGAGALARWFKILISEFVHTRVFLDSDYINKLDNIINVTAWDCHNVVVLLTEDTLRRLWCAAELASAWTADTNIVIVSCDGNSITDELILQIPELWTRHQQASLAGVGLSLSMIELTYTDLKGKQAIELDRTNARSDEHRRAVQEALAACAGLATLGKGANGQLGKGADSRSSSKLVGGNGAMLMFGDISIPEFGCCCRIIQTLLQASLREAVTILNLEDEMEDVDDLTAKCRAAPAILVVLTAGILHNPAFAVAMTAVPESASTRFLPIKGDSAFAYPDPAFWKKLLSFGIVSELELTKHGLRPKNVSNAYSRLFNVIAVNFNSHGSQAMQAAEIQVMKEKLAPLLAERQKKNGKLAMWRGVTGSALSLGEAEKEEEHPEKVNAQEDNDMVESYF